MGYIAAKRKAHMRTQVRVSLYKRLYRAADSTTRRIYGMVLAINQRKAYALRKLLSKYRVSYVSCGVRLRRYIRIVHQFNLRTLKLVRSKSVVVHKRRLVKKAKKELVK